MELNKGFGFNRRNIVDLSRDEKIRWPVSRDKRAVALTGDGFLRLRGARACSAVRWKGVRECAHRNWSTFLTAHPVAQEEGKQFAARR